MVGLLLAGVTPGCAGGDGGRVRDAAPTTTVDPLSEPAIDGCGHDLSALRSTVWAVDARTGAVRWTASIPVDASYVVDDPSGWVRVPLLARSVDAFIDPADGTLAGYLPAGAHEVLVDVNGVATGVPGMVVVDGVQRPTVVRIGDLDVAVRGASGALAADEPVAGSRRLVGTDPATGAERWSVAVAGEVGGVGRPLAYGDLVVVVAQDQDVPVCP